MSALLGGWVEVKSELNKGSTFTLHLPVAYKGKIEPRRRSLTTPVVPERTESAVEDRENEAFLHVDVPDDRMNINEGDRVMLIIEDDKPFATMLLDLARKTNSKASFQCAVRTD